MDDIGCSSSSPNIIFKCSPIRKDLWTTGSTSFHQSFDDRLQLPDESQISNSCSDINQQVYFYCIQNLLHILLS